MKDYRIRTMTAAIRSLFCAVLVLAQFATVASVSAEPITVIRGTYASIDPLFTDLIGVEFFSIAGGTIETDHPLVQGKTLNGLRFDIRGVDEEGRVIVTAITTEEFITVTIGTPALVLDAIVGDFPGAVLVMPQEGGTVEEFVALELVRVKIPATLAVGETFHKFGNDPDLSTIGEADLIWDIFSASIDESGVEGSLSLAGGVPRLVYPTTPTVLLTVVPRGTPVPLPNIPEPSTWALALISIGILAGVGWRRRPGSAGR